MAPIFTSPLEHLFTNYVADTWFIGAPLGMFATLFILLTRRCIAAGTMWAVLWAVLALPWVGGFLLWLVPAVTDPAVIFVIVIGVAGGIGLDHAAASLVKRDDER